jgi:hypothetical protein
MLVIQLSLRLTSSMLKAGKPGQRERNAKRQLECHIILHRGS